MEEIEQEVLDLLQRKTDNTDELTVRFRNAVMLERVKKKLLGIPVARYDKEKRRAYLEYPDGRKVYEDEHLNIPTAEKCMKMNNDKKPEIIVFAGPNGSGKTTVTMLAKIIQPYINADEIKKNLLCEDLEAAKIAEGLREKALAQKLSTHRNLDLLHRAKEQGYFIRCIYVLTVDPAINMYRVFSRVASGGHPVPKDKIISRWHKALGLVPELIGVCDIVHMYDNSDEPFRIFKNELIGVCDIVHMYDNSDEPFRIFKKRKTETFTWPCDLWPQEAIEKLINTGTTSIERK